MREQGRFLVKTLIQDVSVIDQALRCRDPVNLQHLRRFIKPAYLPTHLRTPKQQHVSDGHLLDRTNAVEEADTLFFLIGAESLLSIEDVTILLSSIIQPLPILRRITVPLLSPTSAEQAEKWSREYWPTVYKKTNPFGPHPSIVARAEEEIRHEVGHYMDLATSAGEAVARALKGRSIGAVVVDRNSSHGSKLVALAGDGRWNTASNVAGSDEDNVLGHAVMRVIGLVARKRQDLLKGSSGESSQEGSAVFGDEPITELERIVYATASLQAGGYLCLDLEIYLTHEPCVMCSMAILHSRFGKVIFQKQMPKTGGLTSEVGDMGGENKTLNPSYGLFWRPELNWKLLAWQWVLDQAHPSSTIATDIHA